MKQAFLCHLAIADYSGDITKIYHYMHFKFDNSVGNVWNEGTKIV